MKEAELHKLAWAFSLNINSEQKIAARETKSNIFSRTVPTLSASGSVGEWRDGCGGERRGAGRAIQRRVWAMQAAASWKTRTSMAKWAICVAKYRRDDAQGSATRLVISYFNDVKQLMTKRKKQSWLHCACSLSLLPPSGFWLCNQHVTWTRLPGFHSHPYLVSRIFLSWNSIHL